MASHDEDHPAWVRRAAILGDRTPPDHRIAPRLEIVAESPESGGPTGPLMDCSGTTLSVGGQMPACVGSPALGCAQPIVRSVEVQMPTEPRSAEEWEALLRPWPTAWPGTRLPARPPDVGASRSTPGRGLEPNHRTAALAVRSLNERQVAPQFYPSPCPTARTRCLHRRSAPLPPDDPDRRVGRVVGIRILKGPYTGSGWLTGPRPEEPRKRNSGFR